MRVLVSPGAEAVEGAVELARRLAGDQGGLSFLSREGVRNLHRRLSRAEIHALRRALAGPVAGYVCLGRRVPRGASRSGGPVFEAIAVADHVNLTWRSPLVGPNDESVGQRFPVMAGMYAPEVLRAELGAGAVGRPSDVLRPVPTVVACVADDRVLSPFESAVVLHHGLEVVSAELAAVAIMAAHMGLRLAGVVLVVDECVMAPGAADLAVALMGPERRG